MERLYAMGIACIVFIQEKFEDFESYFELVNNISNPNYIINILVPTICIFDSVFGAQLLLCLAFGGWINSILKLLLQEKRPYWWIRETTFYGRTGRPCLRQTSQTCETGFGSPSGHSMATATTVLLFVNWIEHILRDMECYVFWCKYVMCLLSAFILISVVVSRLYIAAHFPHQCILGALVGFLVSPALCIYIADPYILKYGSCACISPGVAQRWHVAATIATMIISVLVYYGAEIIGHNPQWTIKMAFGSCESPENIQVNSTPLYALVCSTASLLGLAFAVTPDVARYRHYTRDRSLILSVVWITLINYTCKYLLDNVRDAYNKAPHYTAVFTVAALKPVLMLRIVPSMAMWTFEGNKD